MIKYKEKRVDDLLLFSKGIMDGANGSELIKKYKKTLDNVNPYDILEFQNKHLHKGVKTESIKNNVDKIMNVFYESLKKYKWEKPVDGFLYFLLEENNALKEKLEEVKSLLISGEDKKMKILNLFKEIVKFESHYSKKENILFPYIEKEFEGYTALSVMWSIHDDIRNKFKKIIFLLENESSEDKEFKIEIGKIFFLLYGMILKEELILFPIASESVSSKDWKHMHHQSFEYDFPLIDKPEIIESDFNELSSIQNDTIKTETGELTFEQAILIFNKLPLDITFVDENNKVRFFSKPEDRFFPRSAAIIGRDVDNCHPPESVHVVRKIVNSFKNGEKDNAKFWINLNGKLVIIQYFALRNNDGIYKGVLEVSQDITEIKSLEGEQRLLDWEK